MKLKEYIENLNKLAQENPKALYYDVVTAKDDEGNSYNQVRYAPSIGFFCERDFKQTDWDEDDNEIELEEVNAVCVN